MFLTLTLITFLKTCEHFTTDKTTLDVMASSGLSHLSRKGGRGGSRGRAKPPPRSQLLSPVDIRQPAPVVPAPIPSWPHTSKTQGNLQLEDVLSK